MSIVLILQPMVYCTDAKRVRAAADKAFRACLRTTDPSALHELLDLAEELDSLADQLDELF